MKNDLKQKGFTLIELLVVIAIIALLASIVIASLNVSRMKARDSKRIQELVQLRSALEAYKADHGSYPQPNCHAGWLQSSDSVDCWGGSGSVLYQTLVDGGYIGSIPIDPSNTGVYIYIYATVSMEDAYCGETELSSNNNGWTLLFETESTDFAGFYDSLGGPYYKCLTSTTN